MFCKSQFLKTRGEDVDILVGKNASMVTDSQFSFAFLFVFILKAYKTSEALVNSMSKRVKAVLEKSGGHTKY